MTAWNPNAPALLGLEWFPVVTADDVIASNGACFAQRLRSTAAETIGEIRLFVPQVTTPGRYLLEVYPAGSEVPGVVTTATYRPNADSAFLNVQNQAGSTVNLWQSVDEAVLDGTDYIRTVNPSIFGHLWTYKSASAGFAAGRRVLGMRWVSSGRQVGGQHTWEWAIRRQTSGFLRLLRTNYAVADGLFTTTAFLSDINPFTGLPWTQAEVQSFDSLVDPTRLSLRVGWTNPVDASSQGRLFQTFLEVDSVAENRVAYGAVDITTPGIAYPVFPMLTPGGAANWAKAAATDYTYVLRRIAGIGNPDDPTAGPLGSMVGSVGWRYHDDQDVGLPAVTAGAAYAPGLDTNGAIVALGPALTRGRSLILRTTAPTGSVDGIYGELSEAFPNSPPTLRQQVTTTVAQTYDSAMFVVGLADPELPPAGDLTVRVRRFADDVQFGGDGTLTVAEFQAATISAQGWARVRVPLAAPAVLAAATQYYLQWEAVEPEGTGWKIAYGEFPIAFGPFGQASFGGTADALQLFAVGIPNPAFDAWAMLVNEPAQIVGLTATLQQQPLPGDGTDCSVDDLDYVALDWTTSVEAQFGAYEVQRSLDGGTTWETIAIITDQADSEFDDYEGTRGVLTSYRVRQTQFVLEVPGPWSATVTATPLPRDCEVLFVSNLDPSLNVGYNDQTPRTYTFLDADRAVLYPIFERDRQVALQPTERLGDRWEMELVINAVATPSPVGRRLFNAIETIARADLPHVTVLDSDGNRWIALVQVSQGVRREPGALYLAAVAVTEVATAPTPVGP